MATTKKKHIWYCEYCGQYHTQASSNIEHEFFFGEDGCLLARGEFWYCKLNPNSVVGAIMRFAPASKYHLVYGKDEWYYYYLNKEHNV